MTTKNEQNSEKEYPQFSQDIDESSQFLNQSRRRFTKSGLAVSGVLMTLATRPVLGQALTCKSPSGFLSGNASSHGAPPICLGRSPGYWKNNPNWPIGIDTKFSAVFSVNPNSPYASVTMLTLLSHQSFDKKNLGMHLVTAYLNAVTGWTPFLSTETIKAMFAEFQTKGYFSPTAGVKWYGADIVYYLQQTQS
ncbi:MAG: hypothetical protein ABI476_05580 [Oxalobacteraceae bacterium]